MTRTPSWIAPWLPTVAVRRPNRLSPPASRQPTRLRWPTAHIVGGTFLISGTELIDLREHGPVTAVLQVLDEAGHVMETVPYQQPPR